MGRSFVRLLRPLALIVVPCASCAKPASHGDSGTGDGEATFPSPCIDHSEIVAVDLCPAGTYCAEDDGCTELAEVPLCNDARSEPSFTELDASDGPSVLMKVNSDAALDLVVAEGRDIRVYFAPFTDDPWLAPEVPGTLNINELAAGALIGSAVDDLVVMADGVWVLPNDGADGLSAPVLVDDGVRGHGAIVTHRYGTSQPHLYYVGNGELRDADLGTSSGPKILATSDEVSGQLRIGNIIGDEPAELVYASGSGGDEGRPRIAVRDSGGSESFVSPYVESWLGARALMNIDTEAGDEVVLASRTSSQFILEGYDGFGERKSIWSVPVLDSSSDASALYSGVELGKGDFDANGQDDLVISARDGVYIHFREGTISEGCIVQLPAVGNLVGDVDGDGDDELIASTDETTRQVIDFPRP